MGFRPGRSLRRLAKTGVISALFALVPAASANPPPERIDRQLTLFGIEYTFQDQAMVDEPGRTTFETPHKEAKFKELKKHYLEELGAKKTSPYGRPGQKPGVYIEDAPDGRHVVDMEPVTIEINTPPKRVDEIEPAAEKIYRAATKTSLVPYVRPAAERSGMGHIHIGGAKLKDSPFFRHPNLLRNMMVYFHKHPSLLYGFAEAYDIGMNSNIETYHSSDRQGAFRDAVEEFDEWFKKADRKSGGTKLGLPRFLKALKRNDNREIAFFGHYRFINLQHLQPFAAYPDDLAAFESAEGKLTVEARGFRPPRSPRHARANAELLLAIMDRLSEPGYLEPFESVKPPAFKRFYTASKVEADWEIVKRELGRTNPLWDEMIEEYAGAARARKHEAVLPHGAELFDSFSEKTNKGSRFELRIPASTAAGMPAAMLDDRPISLEKVSIRGKEYWIGLLSADDHGFDPNELSVGDVDLKINGGSCLKRSLPKL